MTRSLALRIRFHRTCLARAQTVVDRLASAQPSALRIEVAPVAWSFVSQPRVVSVAPGSAAARAGIEPGDELVKLNGEKPRDIIRYHLLVDEPDVAVEINRRGRSLQIDVQKQAGEAMGLEVHSALFDEVRTCDNHCEFCFIYQLPKGLRRSLYIKDDDYRLSFLYGNYTTLTRFTEADLERVISERLSPLNVSIHATDPDVRADMLRNRRGATSLRWLRALLDHGVEVHGQLVMCPGVNDGAVLDDTLAGVLDQYPELATLCVVPLGVSRFNDEERMRPHTPAEVLAVLDAVRDWQDVYRAALGRRLVFAADEYYLLAGAPFPPAEEYEGFPMHEDGIGMARTFEREFNGEVAIGTGTRPGFFASVDGAPADGYRAPRLISTPPAIGSADSAQQTGVLTGEYGAAVLQPLVEGLGRDDVRVIPVPNHFFGGTTAVTGLLVGEDIARVLASEPEGDRYLLPDVCLTRGRFLDETTPAALPRPVELVAADGVALRRALER
jgi:putative radical SAM enzyme (TIGR03279 family)